MANVSWRLFMLLGAVLAAGCGDPLVDDGYRGPVLFTLRGNVTGSSDVLALNTPVRIAVFWSPRGPKTMATEGLVEQPSASQQAELPFSFTLNLFDAAPSDLFYQPTDGRPAYAIAQLLGYPDLNGNGRHDDDEPFVAASADRAVIYASSALAANQSPTGQPIPAGYHLIYSSIPCGPLPKPMPPPPPGMTCTVPLGSQCSSDAQCAPGVCLKNFLSPWPQGGCGMNDPPPPGCGPPQAIRISPAGTRPMMSGTNYWLQSCTTDADCGRDFPYQCDLSLGACTPTRILVMQVGDPPMVAPWCR